MIQHKQHYVMMKRVDGDIIQCTIKPKHHDAFMKLGFVDNVDRLPKQKQKKSNNQKVSSDD